MKFAGTFAAGMLCLALALMPLSAQGAENDRPTLRVGVDVPYPPFAQLDELGHLFGFDVDLIKAICAEINYSCELTILPFGELLPAIVDGRIDIAIAGMGATEDRKKLVDFSDRYFRSLSIFIERTGEFTDITPESLRGKRLSTQSSTMHEKFLREEYGEVAEIIVSPTFEGALTMVVQGKADLALVDGLPGYIYLKSEAGQGLEVLGAPVSADRILDTASIAVSKNLPEVRKAINRAIETLRRNGEYGKINRKYFDFTVF